MADITPSPNTIQQEEVAYKAAVSEATFTRMGASINYIITRIFRSVGFEFGGRLNSNSVYYGMAGNRYFYRSVEIDHYYLSMEDAGSAGTTAFNAEVYDETNTLLGNLFSTPPSIDSSTGNNSVVGRDVKNGTDIEAGVGKTVGTINYTSIPAGYTLKPFLSSVQTDCENAYFELLVREA